MATIDQKVKYTEKDLDVLVDSLTWRINKADPSSKLMEKVEFRAIAPYEKNSLMCTLTVQEMRMSTSYFILRSLTVGPMENINSKTYDEVWEFLQKTPLENVPLHIHDYPELAKWRLEIGR